MTSAVTVLGAGSWGTALALQLARAGHRVRLWARDPRRVEAMRSAGENGRYLPGYSFPESLTPEAELETAVAAADHALVAVPSQAFGELVERLAPLWPAGAGMAWATKGFEPGTGRLLDETARAHLGVSRPLAVVSGPSFAKEVAADLPTAVTVGASDPEFGRLWAGLLHAGNFRAYYTADLRGVELGGAVKNVLAIACGLADGLELGDNCRAALITRGLAEMMRLGEALGADPRTLNGLAGMGDLVLTCTGDLSRNRRFGMALARGAGVEAAVAEIGQVVEGIEAAREVKHLAERWGVELPISEQVHGILYQGWSASKGVRVLLEREQKPENA